MAGDDAAFKTLFLVPFHLLAIKSHSAKNFTVLQEQQALPISTCYLGTTDIISEYISQDFLPPSYSSPKVRVIDSYS